MNTGQYITPDSILFTAAAMAGDKDFKVIPRGFYLSLIQDAFRELNLDSFFSEQRKDFDFPLDNLTIPLPEDCFNVRNIYIYSGDTCTIYNSKKVWWKRNYYTTGNGYIANDKGNNNDPFYGSHSAMHEDKSLIRVNNDERINDLLFYNIQMGNVMFSSSCRAAGNKVHIHYNGTGGNIVDAPIIPSMFKTAIEDFVIESALRFRMANEPSMARNWMAMQQLYSNRLNKEGMNGSWFTAIMRVKKMNTSQREELKEYLSRGAWSSAF